ncbi:MAG TPA: alpha/beta hydrolase [Anaerolineales bacterium]|nr:alpha/beta hydrolase [Anaerolineales bacterium]
MVEQDKVGLAPRRRGCLWWGLLVLGGLTGLFVLLFLAAFTVEKITLAQIPEKYPMPGELVEVGDYSLHMYCAGDPAARPVVVVSPGSGMSVAHWPLVQPEVAKFARICIYDRPGTGWSFVAPQGQTYQEEAQDVHTMLQNAAVPGPYVLVGHSLGGAVMQVYASIYPQDTLGMVMVDTRTRDIESKYPPEYLKSLKMTEQGSYAFSIPGVFRLLNWFGLYNTVPEFKLLPLELREVAYGIGYNSRHFVYQKALMQKDEQREAQFITAGPLPDVPLIVIAHGIMDQSPGVNPSEDIALQADRI